MQRNIVHKWFFEHSPETVWEYLVRPELISQWLMENDFKPVVGHRFQFNTRPKIKIGFDGIIFCEVLEIVPFKRLSYSWKGGSKGKISLDSVVIWTLTPKENGTELLLEHNGFQGMKNYIAYFFMNEGWRTKIRKRFMELVNSSAGNPNGK